MWKLSDNVPEWYVSESRDFQLISRIHDAGYNSIIGDANSLRNISSTDRVMSNMLELLQTKLGFFTDKKIDNNSLRKILSAFPLLVKNKGSVDAVKRAIYTLMNIVGIKANSEVVITRSTSPQYCITIKLATPARDTSLLTEILKYVVPTGFYLTYEFYTETPPRSTKLSTSMQSVGRPIDTYDQSSLVQNSNSSLQSNANGEQPTGDNYDDVNAIDTMELYDTEEQQ